IELIDLDVVAERFDISTGFPLVQAQNFNGELEVNSNGDDDSGDLEEDLIDLSSALSLIETTDQSGLGYEEMDDPDPDQMRLLAYHNIKSSSYTEADVNIDAVSLLMPELGNVASSSECGGNYVDYDEFNMCLNNILSDNNNDELDVNGSHTNPIANSGKHQPHQNQHQQWRDVSDVITSIVPLNNNLGLSFQEFTTESSVTTDDRAVNSSSSQLA
ncbi:hypothetical protein KR215_000966, partial [Drosophila sulfurigaster]